MREDKVARVVNVAMASTLGALVVGFVAWRVANEFVQVRQIYLSLSPQAQGHVFWFGQSLVLLGFLLSILFRLVAREPKGVGGTATGKKA
jgi:hypothetical protein